MLDFINAMATGIPSMDIPAFDPWDSETSFPFKIVDPSLQMRADGSGT